MNNKDNSCGRNKTYEVPLHSMVDVPSKGPVHSYDPGLAPVPSGHVVHAVATLEPRLGLAVLAGHLIQDVSAVAAAVVLYLPCPQGVHGKLVVAE